MEERKQEFRGKGVVVVVVQAVQSRLAAKTRRAKCSHARHWTCPDPTVHVGIDVESQTLCCAFRFRGYTVTDSVGGGPKRDA
jgi:hypothetical protein